MSKYVTTRAERVDKNFNKMYLLRLHVHGIYLRDR